VLERPQASKALRRRNEEVVGEVFCDVARIAAKGGLAYYASKQFGRDTSTESALAFAAVQLL
jgi:hypothetical protein